MNDVLARTGSRLGRMYHAMTTRTQRFAWHRDPLSEASNWIAIIVGTHLPLWPIYVWWSAGRQAFPTALATMAMTPLFLLVPPIARRSGLLGRIATPVLGVVNTVFTLWVLGANSGTALFFAPCTALAAVSFRRSERWPMLALTSLPLVVYYGLQHVSLGALHHYDGEAARNLVTLNVISVAVFATALGWLQCGLYRRMEETPTH